MTLEDFFTLTEMKDGLTSPSRVEELIAVMKKGKDGILKNIGDATRQWSAVSSTIAATDNKDCLDLFIQLDGLLFINRWLKDAQKFDGDTSESFAEEAITAILGALEKLYIDNDRSTSSGISMTVKNLMDHSSLRIQDRARVLCDRWKQDGSGTDFTIHQDVEKDEGSHDDLNPMSEKLTVGSKAESSALDAPLLKECAKEENSSVEPMKDVVLASKRSGGLESENIEDSCERAHDNHLNSSAICVREEPQVSTKGVVSIESSMLASKQQSVDDRNLTVSTNDESYSPDKPGVRELSAGSTILEYRAVQVGVHVENAHESKRAPALENNVGSDKVEGVTLKSDTESGVDNTGVPDISSTCLSKTASQKAENQESSDKEHISVTPMDAETLVSKMEDCESSLRKEGIPCLDTEPLDVLIKKRKEDTGSAYEGKESLVNAGEYHSSDPKFSKSVMNAKDPDFTDTRRPDIEYDMVDALEVAREVVDNREPSCSSSSVTASQGGIRQPDGWTFVNGNEEQTVSGPPEEMPARLNLSPEEYLQKEEHVMNLDCVDREPENCLPDNEPSQVTEARQEQEANSERGMRGFDLNLEICSDDMDRTLDTISTPISAVSASRPTVSPGLLAAPLQFEGILGWKGSPRRISDGDGSSNGSKFRHDCLDFDLNVAEDGEDKLADQSSGKQIHASFVLPSGKSSKEISSKEPKRLKLDLNCIGDDGDTPSTDIRMEGLLFLHQNDRHSTSPASSSSSMQLSKRIIDLNDGPYIQSDPSQQGLCHASLWHNLNANGGTKPDEPIISIMGTRVEVKRKDFVPQSLSLSNGKAPEFAMDANVARTAAFLGMGPTVHPPAVHNGFTTMSAMHGVGGSIPYMVDSRAPQVVGSASPYAQQVQPFIMGMGMGMSMSMTSPPPSQPNFDLNSGFMIDGWNRESSSSSRQLVIPGQGRSMEESLPSTSVVGTKRKELDAPFSFNYNPPWK